MTDMQSVNLSIQEQAADALFTQRQAEVMCELNGDDIDICDICKLVDCICCACCDDFDDNEDMTYE
jgi:hypothetical protein